MCVCVCERERQRQRFPFPGNFGIAGCPYHYGLIEEFLQAESMEAELKCLFP